MDGETDIRTDIWMDGRTDTPSYREATECDNGLTDYIDTSNGCPSFSMPRSNGAPAWDHPPVEL